VSWGLERGNGVHGVLAFKADVSGVSGGCQCKWASGDGETWLGWRGRRAMLYK
jgi:hypothetical protein